MNKTAIRNFAMWARERMRSDVGTRLGLVGINEKEVSAPLSASTADTQYFDIGTDKPVSLTGENIRRRSKLVREINRKLDAGDDYPTVYEELIESVASTWFNRLIAIRLMEINDYFPDGLRVLSSKETGKQEPEIVSKPFESDLEFSASEREKVTDWRLNNKADELFRLLLFKRCHQLHRGLPGLFADETDPTEFLMKFSVIDPDGVIHHLVNDVDEKDFDIHNTDEDGNPTGQVEIIGWMYQYYNEKRKNEVINIYKGIVKKDDIPAATQLFTTDWVVKYIVDNSLGRYWIERNPQSGLRDKLQYFVSPKSGDISYVDEKISPEEISVLDPCMGSGHFLVYAFDVLMQIYLECGYTGRDAAKSIIEHNLYGLDIDDRAYQLAYFAVMMKAREYNRRILGGGANCNLYSFEESNTLNRAQLHFLGTSLTDDEKRAALSQITGLLDTFTDAKEYGSVLLVSSCDWELLRRFVGCSADDTQITFGMDGIDETREQLTRIINVAKVMSQKYAVVDTNPPYLNKMDPKLKTFVQKEYKDYSSDLFSVFMYRNFGYCKTNGYTGFMTPFVWMFIKSYEALRKYIIGGKAIITLVQMEYSAFEEATVPICTFVLRNGKSASPALCFKLSDFKGGMDVQRKKVLEALNDRNCGYYYEAEQDNFSKIPGAPVAYWASDRIMDSFQNNLLYKYSVSPSQNITGNNNKYVRKHWELDNHVICNPDSWIFYAKGGGYRKWWGNLDDVINWTPKARKIYQFGDGIHASQIINSEYWYKKGITWGLITSALPSFRVMPEGATYDKGGSTIIVDDDIYYWTLGILNSKIYRVIASILNPTLNFQVKDVRSIPLILDKESFITNIVKHSIELSKSDWDSFETSWDFKHHPLVRGASIEAAYSAWEQECLERFNTLKSNEEELNRIFIDIYGLRDELKPEEEDKDVTVRKADLGRDIRSLISYAVGCMFGRYSLDVEGLAFAGGEWDESKYRRFIPDTDNVLSITDEAYLPDDIVNNFCEWLKAAYGADTLEENIDFIAKAIGGDGNSSRDVIRNYFINDFFADHCKTYSVTGSGKRPIYWLFDSGKENGFKALVYMHRWNKDTIARVRSLYLHKIQDKYENEVRTIDIMIKSMKDSRMIAMQDKRRAKLQKQIAEVKVYDEKLDHLANDHIEIDLDDGVKVNYQKVQTDRNGKVYQILAPIK